MSIFTACKYCHQPKKFQSFLSFMQCELDLSLGSISLSNSGVTWMLFFDLTQASDEEFAEDLRQPLGPNFSGDQNKVTQLLPNIIFWGILEISTLKTTHGGLRSNANYRSLLGTNAWEWRVPADGKASRGHHRASSSPRLFCSSGNYLSFLSPHITFTCMEIRFLLCLPYGEDPTCVAAHSKESID